MKKILIKNLITNREWGCSESTPEIESIFQSNIEKGKYGKPDRWVREDAREAYELDLIPIETRDIEFDEVIIKEYHYPADYIIEITDLTNDYDYNLEVCQRNRAKEYPSLGECIEAIFEKFAENRPEKFDDLQAKRIIIKNKYPKPIKN